MSDRFSKIQKDTLADAQELITPSNIRGFSLSDKKWIFFLVDSVQEIEWKADALERLEVDQEKKDIMQALITAHANAAINREKRFDDIIPGKGLGLVFLFAGDPGLGKTLTAG